MIMNSNKLRKIIMFKKITKMNLKDIGKLLKNFIIYLYQNISNKSILIYWKVT